MADGFNSLIGAIARPAPLDMSLSEGVNVGAARGQQMSLAGQAGRRS